MPPEQSNQLRLPPQALEAEQAVLGCMLIEAESVPKVLQVLRPESFYKSAHGVIFKAMQDLFGNNDVIDAVSLIDQLQKNNELENVGGAYFITGLAAEAPSAANVEYYAQIVQSKFMLRSIIEASVELSSMAYEAREDVTDILDKVEQRIFALSEQSLRGRFISVETLLHDVLDGFGTRKDSGVTGVASGIIELDNILSGFQKSDLVILAGRPSMGKTALALSIARNICVDYGYAVGFFSLEMSNIQLTERLITAEAKVDSHLVRTGRLPRKDWKKFPKAAQQLSEARFFIDDSAGLNIMEIRAKARRLKA